MGEHPHRICTKDVALPAKCVTCHEDHSENCQEYPEETIIRSGWSNQTPQSLKHKGNQMFPRLMSYLRSLADSELSNLPPR